MKWIKASERLPEENGIYTCRVTRKGKGEKSEWATSLIYKKDFGFMGGKPHQEDGYEIFVEWLDESPPPTVEEGEVEKMAEDAINDGKWGYPNEGDTTGEFMFKEVKEAWIAGYRAAKETKE